MTGNPRLLADLELSTGVIKSDYADFVVEEIPLYPTAGVGTHTFFLIEKTGLSTMQAIHDIAQRLGVRRMDIGYAGLKDARAVARQWLSVEHVAPERVAALDVARLKVLETALHGNKLRIGHLRGNRFEIRVRGADATRLAALQDGLARLARLGVPNYFGEQRFGARGDVWEIGRAMVRDDLGEAVDLLLGRPGPRDRGTIRQARGLYDAGHFEEARRNWPGMFREERRALRTLAGNGGNRKRAFLSIDKHTRQFYVSAYQSHLFNRVVAARLATGIDRLFDGDLAWLHANGAVFRVESAAAEQPRADAFEISPTGPLFGSRMTEPAGRALEIESECVAAEGLSVESFKADKLRINGGRRPLRFPVSSASLRLEADERGPYLDVRFVLPAGCYATSVLRELFVAPPAEPDEPEDDA